MDKKVRPFLFLLTNDQTFSFQLTQEVLNINSQVHNLGQKNWVISIMKNKTFFTNETIKLFHFRQLKKVIS